MSKEIYAEVKNQTRDKLEVLLLTLATIYNVSSMNGNWEPLVNRAKSDANLFEVYFQKWVDINVLIDRERVWRIIENPLIGWGRRDAKYNFGFLKSLVILWFYKLISVIGPGPLKHRVSVLNNKIKEDIPDIKASRHEVVDKIIQVADVMSADREKGKMLLDELMSNLSLAYEDISRD